MRVSFAGPMLNISRDGAENKRTSVSGHPVKHPASSLDTKSPSQLQPSTTVQSPQRAKFRKMVNNIRAVNAVKNKQVRDALQFCVSSGM